MEDEKLLPQFAPRPYKNEEERLFEKVDEQTFNILRDKYEKAKNSSVDFELKYYHERNNRDAENKDFKSKIISLGLGAVIISMTVIGLVIYKYNKN